MNNSDFWNRVKQLIKSSNTTQKALSETIGLSSRTIEQWIARNSLPDAEQSVLIASALGVTVEYLVTGQQPEQSDKLNDALQNMQNVIDQYKKQ